MLAIMTMSLTKLFARGREATTIRHGIVRQVVECADEFDGRGAANVCGALGKCVSVFDVASSAPLFEALAPRIVDLLPEIVERRPSTTRATSSAGSRSRNRCPMRRLLENGLEYELAGIAKYFAQHAPVDVATELVYLVGCEVSHRLNMGVPCLAQAVQEASMLAYAIGTVITRGGSHLAKLGLDWTESARGVLDLADDVALDPRNDRDVRPETYRLLALGFGGAQVPSRFFETCDARRVAAAVVSKADLREMAIALNRLVVINFAGVDELREACVRRAGFILAEARANRSDGVGVLWALVLAQVWLSLRHETDWTAGLPEPPSTWAATLTAQGVRVSRAQESVSQVLRECGFAHEMEVDLDGTGLTADAADVDARVAVEYDGPQHYLADRTQTGRTRFKHRLVRALGWRLVVVSHYGWEQASDKRAYVEDLLARPSGVGAAGGESRSTNSRRTQHRDRRRAPEEPATDDEGNPEDGASSSAAAQRSLAELQASSRRPEAAGRGAPPTAEAAAADALSRRRRRHARPRPRAAAEAAAAEAGRIIEAQKVELEDASAGAASAGALDALRAAAEATATDLCHTVAAQKTELEAAAGTVRKLTDISADISSRLRRAEVEREEASARLDDLSVRLRDVERERDDKLAQLSRTLARTEAEHDKEKQRHEETKLKLREKCELITLRAKADVDARVAALERERLAQVSIPETTPDAPARAPATASDLANSRGGTCVARVLDTLGLSGKLADKFAEEEIDDRAFGDLEAKEFEEVGASPEEARRIIECRDALVVAFPPADARGAMASPAPMKREVARDLLRYVRTQGGSVCGKEMAPFYRAGAHRKTTVGKLKDFVTPGSKRPRGVAL
ncbi:ryanodine-sensitive calcium-release channel [Aureococcus anophagefferens]|nr:ryanodine-sensitive calcium-release channel [Aureococcus anophagefferens]